LAHGFARARFEECGHDFLIAFSCKGRGVCPSCNARRMAETAAHLVDQVFPPLPVRQWVLSVGKRLRYFLQHDREAISAVLHMLLRVIEESGREACPGGMSGVGTRASEVFLVFVSRGTRNSDFQNAEIGSARLCSKFLDGKLIVPVVIDDVEVPRPIADLDCLLASHRDPVESANEIDEAIKRRVPRVRLLISHSHRDEDLASRLVDVITSGLHVPAGELRCTSVPGYQLDLGTMAPEALRRELGSAASVVAILTPNSLSAEWVLFELGSAWANAKVAIPLLVGGLADKDIPGPFRGAAGGRLDPAVTLDHLIDQLEKGLGWPQRTDLPARKKRYDLVEYVKSKTFPRDPIEEESKASFAAKRVRISANQGKVLDYITAKQGTRSHIPQDELAKKFTDLETSFYYRLEQLRLLGFVERITTGELHGDPAYGWRLSDRYRREVGV
jgi:Transposase zinc-binding domain/TIR domain